MIRTPAAPFLVFWSILAGCTITAQVTPESGVYQELLFHSLERAIAQLDVSPFTGDTHTGQFVNKTKIRLGRGHYNTYKILLVINYTSSDPEE